MNEQYKQLGVSDAVLTYGETILASLRERYTPEEIVGKLAYLAGQNPGGGPRTPEELARGFDWDAVPRQDIRLPEGLS